MFKFKVRYSKEIPDIQDVLDVFHKNTGITELEKVDEDYYLYRCKGFEELVGLDYKSDRVEILSSHRKMRYFSAAMIVALVELGGEFDGKLPKWARKNWKKKRWWEYIPQ